jgi:predicted nucleic acid-binding protein
MGERTLIAALDSSAFILLGKGEALRLLPEVFEGIVVPPAVRTEVIDQAPTPLEANALAMEAERLRFVWKEPKEEHVASLARRFEGLGRGEIQTLALVVSKVASLAITDDSLARRVARSAGIPAVGTLGVLARAHEQKFVSKADLRGIVERIVAAGLWMSPDVLESFWAAIGGR